MGICVYLMSLIRLSHMQSESFWLNTKWVKSVRKQNQWGLWGGGSISDSDSNKCASGNISSSSRGVLDHKKLLTWLWLYLMCARVCKGACTVCMTWTNTLYIIHYCVRMYSNPKHYWPCMVVGLVASVKSQILSHWSLTASGVMGLFFCLTVWPCERSQRTAHTDTHK